MLGRTFPKMGTPSVSHVLGLRCSSATGPASYIEWFRAKSQYPHTHAYPARLPARPTTHRASGRRHLEELSCPWQHSLALLVASIQPGQRQDVAASSLCFPPIVPHASGTWSEKQAWVGSWWDVCSTGRSPPARTHPALLASPPCRQQQHAPPALAHLPARESPAAIQSWRIVSHPLEPSSSAAGGDGEARRDASGISSHTRRPPARTHATRPHAHRPPCNTPPRTAPGQTRCQS